MPDSHPQDTPSHRWVNFKRDVDLGHVITLLSFLGALFVYAQGFDRRVTIVEQKQTTTDAAQAETKADIKEIKRTVSEIGTNLAVQNAIAQSQARTSPAR